MGCFGVGVDPHHRKTSPCVSSEAAPVGYFRSLLVLDVGGYYKNVITFAPSLMISRSEIDEAMVLLDQLLTKAKKA